MAGRQRQKDAAQQALVRHRVEVGARGGSHFEPAGGRPVENVGDGGKDKKGHGQRRTPVENRPYHHGRQHKAKHRQGIG